MKEKRKDLTPPYGHLARLLRPFPDFDPSFIKPVRQKAVELLDLKEGDRVLDVGCGPGGSFPYLVRAVGQSGQVVGVEISPVISINARRRIEKNGWRNVQLIEADARTGIVDMYGGPSEASMAHWPARVVATPDGGSLVIFTAFQYPGVPDDAFTAQCAALAEEFDHLRRLTVAA